MASGVGRGDSSPDSAAVPVCRALCEVSPSSPDSPTEAAELHLHPQGGRRRSGGGVKVAQPSRSELGFAGEWPDARVLVTRGGAGSRRASRQTGEDRTAVPQ